LPAPKTPKPIADLERLVDPFKAKAKALAALIAEERMPMVVYETARPISRQQALFEQGVSRTTLGPHCYGLAMDCVLDVHSRRWVELGGRPFIAVDGGGPQWDTGYNADARGNATLARQAIPPVWWRYGALAEQLGLEWGGRWEWAKYSGYPFGWDVAHVQVKDWRTIVKKKNLAPLA
jgi:hypothetical protein